MTVDLPTVRAAIAEALYQWERHGDLGDEEQRTDAIIAKLSDPAVLDELTADWQVEQRAIVENLQAVITGLESDLTACQLAFEESQEDFEESENDATNLRAENERPRTERNGP